MGALRRVRAFAGHFAVLAVLTCLTTLLVTAVPRAAQRLADRGLRDRIAGQAAPVRDITYRLAPSPGEPGQPTVADLGDGLVGGLDNMPPSLRRVIGERWYAAETGAAPTTSADLLPGPPLALILRTTGGAREAVTLVNGRWPREEAPAGSPVEVVLAATVAQKSGLRIGSALRMAPSAPGARPDSATVVGLFQPRDPAGGLWDALPSALIVTPPPRIEGRPDPITVVALTSDAAVVSRAAAGWPVTYSWRYRVDTGRLAADRTAGLLDGIRRLDRTVGAPFRLSQGLDKPLATFLAAQDAARAVLSVVLAGVLATLGGLVILTALLLVRRRAAELSLLRARGGARTALVRRGTAESMLVVLPAAVLGWLVGVTVPGGAAATGWLVPGAALLVAATLPVAVLVARPAGTGRDVAIRFGPTAYRSTAEATILLLAVLGAVLLRRRGLPPAGQVDPLLVSVPVLLALGAAVLVLRGYPWLLRGAGRITARARGAVAFLGLALARRATTGALLVVVVAVASAAFCGAVATAIRDSRERAVALAVPADALLTADLLAPDTAAALAALPDVRAVTPLVAQPSQRISGPDGRSAERTYVLIVDGPTFARVARESGSGFPLPASLAGDPGGTGPVPAVVSPAVADDVAGGGVVTAQGREYAFRVGGIAASFPTVPPDTRRFVVLAGQSLPGARTVPLTPTGFLLAASRVDPVALRRAGDEGRRRYYGTGAVVGRVPELTPAVTTRAAFRSDLDRGGANGLLSFGFLGGLLGGSLLALAAVVFAVLAGAPARGRTLARLRTMGLSRRQWRRLLIVELVPPVSLAVLTGTAVGALLPLLCTPVLRLSAFTGGAAVRVRADPGLVAGVLVFGILALAVAIAIAAAANRRAGHDRRLSEEN
jgi:putative ABC transport system permease protein